jgi:hypothetical protein
MVVVNFTPRSLYPLEENPVPVRQESGWAPEPVWTPWRKENSLVLAGNRMPSVQHVALATEIFRVKNVATVIEESSKFHNGLFVLVL